MDVRLSVGFHPYIGYNSEDCGWKPMKVEAKYTLKHSSAAANLWIGCKQFSACLNCSDFEGQNKTSVDALQCQVSEL